MDKIKERTHKLRMKTESKQNRDKPNACNFGSSVQIFNANFWNFSFITIEYRVTDPTQQQQPLVTHGLCQTSPDQSPSCIYILRCAQKIPVLAPAAAAVPLVSPFFFCSFSARAEKFSSSASPTFFSTSSLSSSTNRLLKHAQKCRHQAESFF